MLLVVEQGLKFLPRQTGAEGAGEDADEIRPHPEIRLALPHAFDFFREEVRSAEPFFAVPAVLGRAGLLRTHEVPRVRAVVETLGDFAGSPPAA